MKKLSFFALVALMLVVFACKTTETKDDNSGEPTASPEVVEEEIAESNEAEEVSEIPADFADFWTEFKKMIAEDDKAGVMAVCSDDMKAFLESQYDSFINERMKDEVAKATLENVMDQGEMGLLFMYEDVPEVVEEGEEGMPGSTYGFWFLKVDGEWIINNPQMGG